MTLLDRLLLREAVTPLLVGLFAILQLLVLAQLLQLNDVVFSGAVTLGDLARLTWGLLPHFLVMAAPIAYVLGIQLAVRRLAEDRELLALAAFGRSPAALYRVPLALALVFACSTAALVRWAEPQGLASLNRSLDAMLSRNLESGLAPGVFNTPIPRLMLYFNNSDSQASPAGGPRWSGFLLEDRAEEGGPLLAFAAAGNLQRRADSLLLQMSDGELHQTDARSETLARFASATISIDMKDWLLTKNRFATSEAALSPSELVTRAAEAEATGRRDLAQRARLDAARRELAPLTCILFALLAVPLAAMTGGGRSAIYLTTLLVFAVHFSLSRTAVALAEHGGSIGFAALLPHLPAALVGALLTVRFLRRGPGASGG